MSVRMKVTRAKTGSRRAHHALSKPRVVKDPESGDFALRHHVSPATGRYRGRVVVDMAAKLAKKAEKQKRRREEAARLGESVREQKEETATASEKPLDPKELSQK